MVNVTKYPSRDSKLSRVSAAGFHTLSHSGLQPPHEYTAFSRSLGLFIHKMGMGAPTLQVAHGRVKLGHRGLLVPRECSSLCSFCFLLLWEATLPLHWDKASLFVGNQPNCHVESCSLVTKLARDSWGSLSAPPDCFFSPR